MHADFDTIRVSSSPPINGRKPGTWKLAYADFLTALCAFFLMMWIVHGVSAKDKALLAQQFGSEGAQRASAEHQLDALIATVHQAMVLDPFRDSLRLVRQPDGLRLELTDGAENPLFDRGDGSLNAKGIALLRATGRVLADADVLVRIEGHTDSTPLNGTLYSNWELSSDRAHAARRLLIASGLPGGRIRAVAGLADTRPLVADKPHLPANRRVSIVLTLTANPVGA